jgi:hypothetical protein
MAHLRLVRSAASATAPTGSAAPNPIRGLLEACKRVERTPEMIRQRALRRARALASRRSDARALWCAKSSR